MGYIPESSLEKANADLRKAVMAMQPGQITGIIHTSEGYRILKVISKEPAGQRELTDPKVQQTIRETLINRKDQLLKAAYYEVARNEAQVKNYFAVKVFSASAHIPGAYDEMRAPPGEPEPETPPARRTG